MSSDEAVVFDPETTQLQALTPFGIGNLQPEDLASLPVVHLLLDQQRLTVVELKAAKHELSNVRLENSTLRQDREDLRVEVAKLDERVSVSWVEIAAGITAGFAGNMLTNDWQNPIGWFLLIVSLFMIAVLRGIPMLSKRREHEKGKE